MGQLLFLCFYEGLYGWQTVCVPASVSMVSAPFSQTLARTPSGRVTVGRTAEPLLEKGFCRINSCYVVNLAYLQNIRGYEAILDTTVLKISRPRKKELVRAFEAYRT